MTSDYETQTGQIETGWDVYDVNGDEIGDVSEVGPNYIVVEKGWLFPTDIYIPNSAIASVAPDRVQLSVAKDAIESQDWTARPAEGAYEGDYNAGAESASGGTLERREERLDVGKEAVQTGEVRIGKEVVEEQQSVEVPVTREEVQVNTRSVDRPASGEAFQEGEISVPVSEERVTVDKEARVVEELDVDKVARQETEQVTDTVRREEFRVDDSDVRRQ